MKKSFYALLMFALVLLAAVLIFRVQLASIPSSTLIYFFSLCAVCISVIPRLADSSLFKKLRNMSRREVRLFLLSIPFAILFLIALGHPILLVFFFIGCVFSIVAFSRYTHRKVNAMRAAMHALVFDCNPEETIRALQALQEKEKSAVYKDYESVLLATAFLAAGDEASAITCIEKINPKEFGEQLVSRTDYLYAASLCSVNRDPVKALQLFEDAEWQTNRLHTFASKTIILPTNFYRAQIALHMRIEDFDPTEELLSPESDTPLDRVGRAYIRACYSAAAGEEEAAKEAMHYCIENGNRLALVGEAQRYLDGCSESLRTQVVVSSYGLTQFHSANGIYLEKA